MNKSMTDKKKENLFAKRSWFVNKRQEHKENNNPVGVRQCDMELFKYDRLARALVARERGVR